MFGAGFGAALLGTMGGGGAGFVALYALLLVGSPLNAALATFKLGDLGFSPAALYNFSRAGLMKKRLIIPLLFLEGAGAILGTILIIRLPNEIIKYVLTIILVPLLIFMLWHGNATKRGKASIWWKPVYFFGSLSTASLQVGSFIGMFALMDLRKTPALEAAANRFMVVFPFEIISVGLLLSFSSLVNIHLGIPLFVGNLFGAYFGSKIAIKGGNKFVRYMFLGLMAATLLTVWLKRA